MFFCFSAWLFRFSFKGKVVMISGSTRKDMCTARGLEAIDGLKLIVFTMRVQPNKKEISIRVEFNCYLKFIPM